MTTTPGLDLKPEPDGFGFLYGTLVGHDGATYRVDIMPPLAHWHGDIKMTGEGAPHPTDWVIYVDGHEIARVTARDAIEAKVLQNVGGKRRMS